MPNLRRIAICFLSLSLTSCSWLSTPSKSANKPSSSSVAKCSAKFTLPKVSQVLDGTDLVAIETFALQPIAASKTGTYKAEQGGSELSLNVKRHDDHWIVQRVYNEPEQQEVKRVYKACTYDEKLASRDEGMFIQATSEGLLLLEQKSRVESIPSSYWIHYRAVK